MTTYRILSIEGTVKPYGNSNDQDKVDGFTRERSQAAFAAGARIKKTRKLGKKKPSSRPNRGRLTS